jgi:hypothetical protein
LETLERPTRKKNAARAGVNLPQLSGVQTVARESTQADGAPSCAASVVTAVKIFLPFTRLKSETYESVRQYSPTLVPLLDDYAYSRYFIERWHERETFLNVEHDIVVDSGVVETLRECPKPWCSVYYGPLDRKVDIRGFMGCMKFSRAFIDAHPAIWFRMKWGELDRILPRVTTWTLHLHVDVAVKNLRDH